MKLQSTKKNLFNAFALFLYPHQFQFQNANQSIKKVNNFIITYQSIDTINESLFDLILIFDF